MSRPPLVFIIAGEASGDQLGADLMASLKKIQHIRFEGIGGEAMAAQGLKSLFHMEELSLMGVSSILRNLPNLWRRLNETLSTIQNLKPDAVVTIDVPEFSFRVMKRLHKKPQRPRLIHYVAPTVWAWRAGRAKKIARFLDHLLCLYPFEPPYFEKYGLKATFVGHPIAKEKTSEKDNVEKGISLSVIARPQKERGNPKHAPTKAIGQDSLTHGLLRSARNDLTKSSLQEPKSSLQSSDLHQRDPNLLCVLPGSRRSEIETLLPIFKKTVELLREGVPNIKVIIPTLPSREALVRQSLEDWIVEGQIVVGEAARQEAFQKSFVALAASGTVALQLTVAHLPFVIAYKLGKLNEWIARFLLKTPWACMVNILLAFKKFGRNFVLTRKAKNLVPESWIPEFLQQDCTPEKLAQALLNLLKDKQARTHQIKAMKEVVSLLRASPDAAARAIADEIA